MRWQGFVMTDDCWIEVSLPTQRLRLLTADDRELACYVISTATNGPGELTGSECTPRGWHRVRAKIGAGAPCGAVFVGRRQTGEICTPQLVAANPQRDWILTRVLWLSGTEVGRNRLGRVDTMRRYIYIHGAPQQIPMGVPGSHGCVRMRNADVIDLFDRVAVGTPVHIAG